MTALKSCTLAAAAVLLTACGGGGGDKAPALDPAIQAKLATLPAPYNTADFTNGKVQFAQCRSCHTIVKDGADMTGPNLHGLFGHPAGGKPGYHYSDALKAAGFTWDPQRLDAWLANPRTYMPGTKMTFLGLPEAKDRNDVIAYLLVETDADK